VESLVHNEPPMIVVNDVKSVPKNKYMNLEQEIKAIWSWNRW